eukprot:TRINITY_DN3560_c0_g1_i1.p1 TRINITY_DN3560_c0_g1~~TRINITY_DN3560_c0_g1_i1.p1  ORF type:complete len:697 (-),score=96.12 TRINITY_DN3560_c0_g1_i1:32-2122(-)
MARLLFHPPPLSLVRRLSGESSSEFEKIRSLERGDRNPIGFWKATSNQRILFENIAKQLNVNSPQDWYKVTPQQIREVGGSAVAAILKYYYGNSHLNALSKIYPEVSWSHVVKEKQEPKPPGYWSVPSNQRAFLDQLGVTLQLSDKSFWYDVSESVIAKHGGSRLLKEYGGSPMKLITSVYPDEHWDLSKFRTRAGAKPANYWKDKDIQRKFFDDLFVKLKLKSMEDWYAVTQEQIQERGGGSLLSHFQRSPGRAITSVYPDYKWNPAKFRTLNTRPRNFWSDLSNQRNFFDSLQEQLSISHWRQWFNITAEDVRKNGGAGVLDQHRNSLIDALSSIYPEHDWSTAPSSSWKSGPSQSKHQELLFSAIQEIFQGNDIHFNYQHPTLKFPLSGKHIQLDIYVPKMEIAFEYQGEQHFVGKNREGQRARDAQKRQICEANGITLIEVPYWWNGTVEALVGTIRKVRPDIDLLRPPNVRSEQISETPEYWSLDENVRRFMEAVSKRLGVKELDDWYRVSLRDLQRAGGRNMIGYFQKSLQTDFREDLLLHILRKAFPNSEWTEKNFWKQQQSKSQQQLYEAAADLFRCTEIHTNFLHPRLRWKSSNKPMELDLYIPAISLAFEYQGMQHYEQVPILESSMESALQKRDNEKAEACRGEGIALVVVPFWWDGSKQQLIGSITKIRPDLIQTLQENERHYT